MFWNAMGAVFLVLVAAFIVGHVWFHVVEKGLEALKRLLFRKPPAVWHEFPPEEGGDEPDGPGTKSP